MPSIYAVPPRGNPYVSALSSVAVDAASVLSVQCCGPLGNVALTAESTSPRPIETWGAYVYGVDASGYDLYRQPLTGGSWTLVTTNMPAAAMPSRMFVCDDGELLVAYGGGVYKSAGWATPDTATWSSKITPNGTSSFLPWGIDGDGTKFIVVEYSSVDRADSRYCKVSLDGGDTWSTVYDSVTEHGATLANSSHLHGACYDAFSDRFYLVEGHDDGGSVGDLAGLYYSDDDGVTWARATGMALDPGPTVVTATDTGLVCGTDNDSAGLYGVTRQDDPDDEVLVKVWDWPTARTGVVGFAQRGTRDPVTGVVYVSFLSNFSDAPPVIAAGSPTSGDLIYQWDAGAAAGAYITHCVVTGRRFIATGNNASTFSTLEAVLPAPGARRNAGAGHLIGGYAYSADAIAVGVESTATTAVKASAFGARAEASAEEATAVGYDATATGVDATAVGSTATATGTSSTAIGSAASSAAYTQAVALGAATTVTGTSGTALGQLATAASEGVAVGRNAAAVTTSVAIGVSSVTTSSQCVAVGKSASAGVSGATAVGYTAVANASGGATAVGYAANASHQGSIALGYPATTTDILQFKIPAVHMEMVEVTTPAAGATNSARLFAVDNGAGKTQLAVRFATGAVQILATEP